MALNTSRFVPYAVHLVGSAKWINQIKATPLNVGASLFEEASGSQTDRAFVASKSIEPTVNISTTDLTILSTIGFSGLSVTGATAVPVVLYARELPLGAVPSAVASGKHISCSVSDCLLVPTSISASHNSVANISLMLHAILGSGASSGATPFVLAVNQNIATADSPEPATNNIYTTGPVHFTTGAAGPAISPRLLQGIESISVDFGIQIIKESTDGDVYPSYVAIQSRAPRIEFSTKDINLSYEVGDGIAISAFDAYFRQVATNGQRVAAATATHCKITGTTGMLHCGSTNLAHQSPGTASFTFTPASAAPNLSISTTSAIPTTA